MHVRTTRRLPIVRLYVLQQFSVWVAYVFCTSLLSMCRYTYVVEKKLVLMGICTPVHRPCLFIFMPITAPPTPELIPYVTRTYIAELDPCREAMGLKMVIARMLSFLSCKLRVFTWLEWMTEEKLSGNRPLLDQRRMKDTTVAIVYRWYEESWTMARNPRSTGFFLCCFQCQLKRRSILSYTGKK